MDLQESDFDRLLFFEHACKTAEATHTKNPSDADNLVRWAGALLELSQFQNVQESKNMVQEAILKLEKAVVLKPKKHDALWCLGNALTTRALLNPDLEEAKCDFDTAIEYFKIALAEEPGNPTYQKSLEVSAKAPELHVEIHRHGLGHQMMGAADGSSTSSATKTAKNKKSSDLKYDIFGWIILAVGIYAWLESAKSNAPPPPQQ